MPACRHLAISVFAALSVSVLLMFSVTTFANATPAEPPTPVPIPTVEDSVITYFGVDNWTYDDGETEIYDGTFGADCSTGTCLLFGYVDEEVVPRVEVIDGRASFDSPATGPYCSQEYHWASTTTVSFEGETATLTQVTHSPGLVDCPDGTKNQYIGNTSVTSGNLVSGNPCFITDSCPKPEPTATPTPTAEAIAISTLPIAPSRALDEPSILSTLPTAAEAVTTRNALWATAMALILALLIAFPKHLLSSAAASGSKRLAKWGEKFTATAGTPVKRLRILISRITSVKGWQAATIGITIAAIISSFVDPEFGWNTASIRTFVSILVSLALQIVTGWLLLMWLVRRTHPSAKAEFEFRPLTLLVVVTAVVLSRLTGFEPGIIFGLVAGLSFGALLATAERARVALIGLGRAFVLSLIAWIGYSLLSTVVDGGPVIVFINETLSSVTIAGIVALPIALIPFSGTTGQMLWKWNRWIWAGSYVAGLIGFFLILMPMPFSWKSVPMSLSVWIGLFVAYSAGSLILWAIIVRPWKKEESVSEAVAKAASALESVPEDAG